jgi:hypothetical protein
MDLVRARLRRRGKIDKHIGRRRCDLQPIVHRWADPRSASGYADRQHYGD